MPKSVMRRIATLEHRLSSIGVCGRCEESCPKGGDCPEWFFREFLKRLERRRQIEEALPIGGSADRKHSAGSSRLGAQGYRMPNVGLGR